MSIIPEIEMNKRNVAFTLIELLVVIGIIAVLAAILFPVFAAAREHARSTACLSNVKQIAAAITMYSSDYDESIVAHEVARGDAPLDIQIAGAWTSTLQPYIKNTDVLLCPSYDDGTTAKAMDDPSCDGNGTPGSGSTGYIPAAKYLAHYGAGLHLSFGSCKQSDPYASFAGSGWSDAAYPGLGNNGPPTFLAQSLATVPEPARTAIAGDGATLVRTDTPAISVLYGCEGQYRHKGGGANLAFLDGHAKFLVKDPERYQSQDDAGCFYETYFTADR